MARDYYVESYEEYEDDYECDCCDDCGYELTEQDSCGTLTDGIYGEMSKTPWEYDAMMDAMGF